MPRSVIYVPAAAAALALGLVLTTPEPAAAQSFNCRYAHYSDEAAICQDQALGRLDNELNSVFNNTMRRLPPEAQRRLDRDEDAWVLQRRQCAADPVCITQAYQRRMRQLLGETGAADQPQRNPPPGFPPPPPQFRPFGAGPVAVGPGFPPPLPPGFRQPEQGGVKERDTRAPLIERRQSTETVEERNTPEPQPAQRNEGATVGPSQTTTTTAETRSAPDQGDTETSQTRADHKSSRHAKKNRAVKRETITESQIDQATPDKPTTETAVPPKPPKEIDAAAPPVPPPPQQSSGSSASAAKPVIRWVDPPPSQ